MRDFKEIEQKMLAFWKKAKIYDKVKKKRAKGKPFYFLQGPPYTSGKIHIGTAWNNSLKDLIMRYKRMQGFDVWDRAGYDMHGLPIANRVQKNLKLGDKKDIEKYGVDKFVKKCQEFSTKNKEAMDVDLMRLGVWMDFKNAYLPVENDFMGSEWGLIKSAFDQKRLYKGEKTMQWCGKCETSLAKHELEYESVQDNSIYVRMKLKDREGYLLIWTTTPWTIPLNLGVMVNPDIDYVSVEVDGEQYIVAKELAKKVFEEVMDKDYLVLSEFKGTEMEGWEYIHPFKNEIDYASLKKVAPKVHTVLLSKEYVNLEAGTGLVHTAPGCGPEDYEVGKANNIPPFNPLDEKGVCHQLGKFDGLVAKKDDARFIEALKSAGALIAEEQVQHDYAHCWRCHNPIIYRTTTQWFLKIQDLIPKILSYDKKINWVPNSAKKSYEAWIENLRDNGITRQRFWGTPLPVWECPECGKVKVIGSVKELQKEAIGKLPENLHKPWIDDVKIKCDCGKEMSRCPDVLDVWIDSGTVSWNCLYYPKKKDLFERFFPADLILEATEQTRLWFSLLQLCSEIMFGKSSYKNVYAHGMIFDFQGTKMSKSIGNIISPYEVIDKYSSDVFRYYMCEIKAGENINFNWEGVKLKQRNLIVLMNIQNYLLDLLNQTKLEKLDSKRLGIEEKYILSRANATVEKVTSLFEKYKLDETITETERLFLDLSRVYIKMTRDKSNKAGTREVVASTILDVYLKCLKMFAPVCPLFIESLWQELREKKIVKEESVHLCDWPAGEGKVDHKLEEEMSIALEVIEKGLAERDKAQIGLKWPLAKATISYEGSINKELNEIIKSQLNIKEIRVVKGKEPAVKLDTKMTPELEAEGYAREVARKIQAFRRDLGLNRKDLVSTTIIVDDEFKNILETQKTFIKERTNSKKLEIVTTGKERFKNKTDFRVKDKKGVVTIQE